MFISAPGYLLPTFALSLFSYMRKDPALRLADYISNPMQRISVTIVITIFGVTRQRV